MENQTNGNSTTETTTPKVDILKNAKEIFAKRKAPPSKKEQVDAWKAYMAADDACRAAEEAFDQAKLKRTQACKALVEVRGSSPANIEGRGLGRITQRGESAWVLFPSSDAGEALSLK